MTDPAATSDRTETADAEGIDLYWRPGCGFCSSLRRGLDKMRIERVEHDIWADPEAAAVVRSVAGGNETVPTVVIGDVGMVNPTAKQVVAVLREHAPHLLPEDGDATVDGEHQDGGTLGRLLERLRGG
jgi:glutaredoxin-like protein